MRLAVAAYFLVAVETAMGQAAPDATVTTFLNERLQFWQEQLNLQEWKVTVQITPRSGLKAATLGGIRWDKPRKTATMAVLDPADYNLSKDEMLKDLEFTIVHELIHLELASLPRSEASRRTEELAVNNLTKALLALHRDK